jgi:hypothetical protein
VEQGHRPLLALVVDVEEVFSHCAKAFLRSRLWEPAAWHPDDVPSRARIAQRQERAGESLADLERYYGDLHRGPLPAVLTAAGTPGMGSLTCVLGPNTQVRDPMPGVSASRPRPRRRARAPRGRTASA